MSKIAIINLGSHGHVNPTLALTQELVARGHSVTYVTTAEFAAAIRVTGATLVTYESQFGKQSPSAKTVMEMMPYFPLRLLGEAAHVVPQILPSLSAFAPDVVLYDPMCVAGRLVAEILKTPAVTLYPTYVANEHFSLWRSMNVSVPTDVIATEFHQLARSLAVTHGIGTPTIASMKAFAEPLNIVFMPRSFHPQSELFDDSYVFVGPGFTTRPSSGSWVPSTVKRERRLFVSMGTVFNDWPEFFAMAAEAFGGSDWEVLMAIGNRVDPTSLGEIPDNIKVAPYWPQLDIRPHTAVAIVHGGMGTTMEALSFGVPLVVIPQMPEQAMTARRVEELGLGVTMSREQTSVQSLIDAVRKIVTCQVIRSNVTTLRDELDTAKNIPGYMKAADAVDSVIERNRLN